MIGQQVLTVPEVARLLRLSAPAFYRARKRLETEGFPPPLPIPGRLRYAAAALQRWLDSGGRQPASLTDDGILCRRRPLKARP